METIENKTFDEERALYASDGVTVKHCRFDGPADGESAFKESRNIAAEDCYFNLRYPFWHTRGLTVRGCEMTEKCRAASAVTFLLKTAILYPPSSAGRASA